MGEKVDPAIAAVEVDGVPLPVNPDLTYYLAYKPRGVVSTAHDPQDRPTVVELGPDAPRLFPVGRLDVDSEGLVLLTNDGDLANRLTHPRYGVPKTYLAEVDGRPAPGALRRLIRGIELDDGRAAALGARVLEAGPDRALVEVVMGEGRKRQVRRMLDGVGHPCRRLVRVAIGPLRDRDLTPGTSRPLTGKEVRSLYAASSGMG